MSFKSNFVDYVSIFCKSGNGGSGSANLRRDKITAKGGPDGGDGGRGGHIIVRGNRNKWTLLHLKFTKHVKASSGQSGGKSLSTGAQGKDIYIDVPLGTVVKNLETNKVIFEIENDFEENILLFGGIGGKGNAFFKNSTRQTPRFSQSGKLGSEGKFSFELKVLADVGLVGFPNAGKSTLLSVLTSAKPKIADYEFTTLVPNLGIVDYRNEHSFIMADIPGIIEGASEGKGLGHRFLRHIERNSCLIFLIPINVKDIMRQYLILLDELEKYDKTMLLKKRILVVSKCDLLDEKKQKKILKTINKKIPHVLISSISNTGLLDLKDKIWSILNPKHD
tara:strand:- start:33143 stop:34147 length:1005 start_codon:yes stop_codon:yes gene_type:complete